MFHTRRKTMANPPIVSNITDVYLKYGIVQIGRTHLARMPTGDKSLKVEAVFDRGNKAQKLTYDPLKNRFFGVKGWYNAQQAKAGDKVCIEPLKKDKCYRLSLLRRSEFRAGGKQNLASIGKTQKKGRGVSAVGKPVNFGGLVYAPNNEAGVVLLFGMIFEDLGIIVEEIKNGFPDATIRRFNGKGWVREFAEFEYESMNFKKHRHAADKCDMIVCWRDNWKHCPLEVCELSSLIKLLPKDRRRLVAKTFT